jgi:hypothetical protein
MAAEGLEGPQGVQGGESAPHHVKFPHIVCAFIAFASGPAKLEKKRMRWGKRDVQKWLGTLGHVTVAVLIWVAVVYSLLTPPPPAAFPGRIGMAATRTPCLK